MFNNTLLVVKYELKIEEVFVLSASAGNIGSVYWSDTHDMYK